GGNRLVQDAHAAASDFVDDFVSGSGKVRLCGDILKVSGDIVRQPRHTSIPNRERTSLRNSRSETVTSRTNAIAISRKRRRAAASRLVTVASVTPCFAASCAYVTPASDARSYASKISNDTGSRSSRHRSTAIARRLFTH